MRMRAAGFHSREGSNLANAARRAGKSARRPSPPRRGGSSLAQRRTRLALRSCGRRAPGPVAHTPGGEEMHLSPVRRRGIMAGPPQRMAATESGKAHPKACPRAMGPHARHRVMRTARPIATAHAERSKCRRERELIEAQKSEGERGQHGSEQEARDRMEISRSPYHIRCRMGRGNVRAGRGAIAALTTLLPWRISPALLRAGRLSGPPVAWEEARA